MYITTGSMSCWTRSTTGLWSTCCSKRLSSMACTAISWRGRRATRLSPGATRLSPAITYARASKNKAAVMGARHGWVCDTSLAPLKHHAPGQSHGCPERLVHCLWPARSTPSTRMLQQSAGGLCSRSRQRTGLWSGSAQSRPISRWSGPCCLAQRSLCHRSSM